MPSTVTWDTKLIKDLRLLRVSDSLVDLFMAGNTQTRYYVQMWLAAEIDLHGKEEINSGRVEWAFQC